MKYGVLLLVGVAASLLMLSGCESVNDSQGENFNRVAHTVDTDGKLLPVAVEKLLFLYQPTQLAAEPVPDR